MFKILFLLLGDESVCQQYLNFTSASSASESEHTKKVVDFEKSKCKVVALTNYSRTRYCFYFK